MNTLLQNDRESVSDILQETFQLANEHFHHQDQLPPGRYIPQLQLVDLPSTALGARGTLNYFKDHYAPQLNNSAGPRYFGFVTGGSTPASIAGDWLVSTYDQNNCGSHDSIAPQLENQTLHFLKQLLGLDIEYFGSFVTGATMSNFVGLAIARQWVGEQLGIDVSMDGIGSLPLNIVSASPHSSIIKSLSMLGVGRKNITYIDTLPNREAIDISKLENYLKQHTSTPCIVVANAGTVNTVDFDDLEAIGKLRSTYKFWLHVDAAFGGFAAVSEKYAHLVKGINHADSITTDAHKWLNVPYDGAMQFTRHKQLQLKVFQNSAAYLGDPATSPDYFHYTPENSRRWRSLPSWFTLMAYGREGYKEIVERNCYLATRLGEWIYASEKYRLLAPVKMNIVCFTLNNPTITAADVKSFLDRVRDDGRVFFTPTMYKGIPAIRAAVSNWQTQDQDLEIVFKVLQEI